MAPAVIDTSLPASALKTSASMDANATPSSDVGGMSSPPPPPLAPIPIAPMTDEASTAVVKE
jgi:hypothetical protein